LACSSDATRTASDGGSGGTTPSGAGASGNTAGATSIGGAGGAGVAGTAGAVSTAGGTNAGGANAGGGSANAAAGSGGSTSAICTGNATYKVTVNVTWADPAVSDKHYTTIIGGVHSSAVSFWKLGGLATQGIKEMAEMGSTTVLATEVKAAITAGSARSLVQFGGGGAPGSSSAMIELSGEFPLLSFGSMLAPTPDWFVGVSSLNLCESGAWVPTKTLDAVVYDAGTKDGADFDYGFPETNPPVAIAYSVKFPNQAAAGTLLFEKQ